MRSRLTPPRKQEKFQTKCTGETLTLARDIDLPQENRLFLAKEQLEKILFIGPSTGLIKEKDRCREKKARSRLTSKTREASVRALPFFQSSTLLTKIRLSRTLNNIEIKASPQETLRNSNLIRISFLAVTGNTKKIDKDRKALLTEFKNFRPGRSWLQ